MKMTTRWVGEPVPCNFSKGVEALVPLARQARRRMVEFDWQLSVNDVGRLREAIMYWGPRSRGRYKKFDAQVLEALERAIRDVGSPYRLPVPTSGADVESEVEASRSGDEIRLRGRAGFDVIVGYSVGTTDESEREYRRQLGDDLADRLHASIAELGWDIDRLRSSEFRAALNALWSLPLAYARSLEGQTEPREPSHDLSLRFLGPLAWDGPARTRRVSDAAAVGDQGIYLITVPVGGVDHVHYVGQTTRGFANRLGEHMSSFVSGRYSIYEAQALASGVQKVLWHGAPSGADYCRMLPDFLARTDELAPRARDLVRLFRCYVASVPGEKQLVDKVEGALGRYYARNTLEPWGSVFAKGSKHPAPIPGAARVRLRLSSEAPIAGLPEELIA